MKQHLEVTRHTKIVATLGPATTDQKTLQTLIAAGVNVARVNMSHGDHTEHAARIKNLRAARAACNAHTGILIDLAGPKIRTGDLTTDTVTLVPGKKVVLTTKAMRGDAAKMSVNYKKLPQEVRKGSIIMLDDGRRKLKVLSTTATEITCRVVIGGTIKPRRGVNVPGAYLSLASITAKDKRDIQFALSQKADFIALSFVRTARDVQTLKRLIKQAKKQPRIIAKIETPEAVDRIDEILAEADGIMVARGDLAIEIPREQVPVVQKCLIRKAREAKKVVITATQMLESMVRNPVPTRAEVSDISTAIFDGTDAVMLSEESAMGPYAADAVAIMRAVAIESDAAVRLRTEEIPLDKPSDAIKKESCAIALAVDANVMIVPTETGATARRIAGFRSTRSIIAVTEHPDTATQLSLVRGVWPIVCDGAHTITELQKNIRVLCTQYKLARKGDRVVVVSGMRFGTSGKSNMLFVETL
ncbi:MAG: pyruvate kinase [Candidatus Pacebacteria bacterium]|nr:pyruvate kinase [Candidatus Paceibacterota bacterium]